MAKSYTKCVLALALMASPLAKAMSLQEAMKIAFERNPRTQANDLKIQAMHQRTRAAWAAFLPTFGVSYDLSKAQTGFNTPGFAGQDTSTTRGLNLNAGMTLYNGGATHLQAKAAEASEKALEAQMNSTNALIPNTKGAIASLVFDAYTETLSAREQVIFVRDLKAALLKIMTAAQTNDEKNQIQSALDSLEITASSAQFQIESGARDFEYVVKAPVPEQMASYDEAINSIEIPKNSQAALEISMQKSPELKVAAYRLESMQLSYQAEKAEMTRPHVSLNVSKGLSNTGSSAYGPQQSHTTTVGVSIGMNFSASRVYQNKAAALEVEAEQKNKDGELDELRHKLDSTYPMLENFLHMSASYEHNLATSQKNMDDFLKRVDQGEKGNITYALNLVQSLSTNWSQVLMTKQNVLSTKFKIQKTIGTLFQQVEGAQ